MNSETFGAGFGALAEEDQRSLVGGDAATAYAVGFVLGVAAHWIEAGYWAYRAMDLTPHGYANAGYFATLAK